MRSFSLGSPRAADVGSLRDGRADIRFSTYSILGNEVSLAFSTLCIPFESQTIPWRQDPNSVAINAIAYYCHVTQF